MIGNGLLGFSTREDNKDLRTLVRCAIKNCMNRGETISRQGDASLVAAVEFFEREAPMLSRCELSWGACSLVSRSRQYTSRLDKAAAVGRGEGDEGARGWRGMVAAAELVCQAEAQLVCLVLAGTGSRALDMGGLWMEQELSSRWWRECVRVGQGQVEELRARASRLRLQMSDTQDLGRRGALMWLPVYVGEGRRVGGDVVAGA